VKAQVATNFVSAGNAAGLRFLVHLHIITKSSATAKRTARSSCLVGVLYNIYRETINRSTANQPLLRNWPRKLPNSAK